MRFICHLGPKQQDQDDEDAAASGQPTEADGSFDYSRRQSSPPFKQPPPVSNLIDPLDYNARGC